MSKLDDARKKINEIDQKMAFLFEERMKASEDVAEYKKEHALPIFDSSREDEIIKRNSLYISDETIREYYVNFLKNNMDISRIKNPTPKDFSRIETRYRPSYVKIENKINEMRNKLC